MIIESDIREIIGTSRENLLRLSNSSILILGGSGFIGNWLLRTFLLANIELKTNIRLTILTRNIIAAKEKLSGSSSNEVSFIEQDIRKSLPTILPIFSHVIFGATPSSVRTGNENKKFVFESTVTGMNNVLTSLKTQAHVPIFVHLSSGAVYGDPRSHSISISESEINNENLIGYSNYSRAKIEAEYLVREATLLGQVHGTNPRLFAFAGPGIALDEHFAIGNFLNDRLNERKIRIEGSPETIRSYLYPIDLCNWLIASLVSPVSNPIHIGSSTPITMYELAEKITSITKGKGIEVVANTDPKSIYFPETRNTEKSLNVKQTIDLDESIKRWWRWIE